MWNFNQNLQNLQNWWNFPPIFKIKCDDLRYFFLSFLFFSLSILNWFCLHLYHHINLNSWGLRVFKMKNMIKKHQILWYLPLPNWRKQTFIRYKIIPQQVYEEATISILTLNGNTNYTTPCMFTYLRYIDIRNIQIDGFFLQMNQTVAVRCYLFVNIENGHDNS